jgi:[acyl-carrier-protein] S-malonyltransferase
MAPARQDERQGMASGDLLERSVALVFPGQGSQFVGMGRSLAATSDAARRIFVLADEVLGFSISQLCFEGPAATLEDTINAQPAILTTSAAVLAALEERVGAALAPLAVAGHSLGEFTALVAAGVLELAPALGLVRERGRLMKEAGEDRPGGMAAVIGLDEQTLAEVCAEAGQNGVVGLANANCPGQIVISGEVGPLLRAMELARERGAKRVARLGISIASHSPLMEGVSARLGEVLDRLELRPPVVPVVANGSGLPMSTVADIRRELSHHVERPVNWTRSVQEMVNLGATTFVEVGPGSVLSGLIKRIDRNATVLGPGDFGLPSE